MNIYSRNGSRRSLYDGENPSKEISNRRAYARFLQLLLVEAIQQQNIEEGCQIASILLESPAASLDTVWKVNTNQLNQT